MMRNDFRGLRMKEYKIFYIELLKTALLFVWQLPQNIIGFFITRFSVYRFTETINKRKINIWCNGNFFNSAVSLGHYIIIDYISCLTGISENTIRHERGHQIQSERLGWLYLPLVGLPSIARNIWDRIFHRKWDSRRRSVWYYSGYPERQADRLGNVCRKRL